MKKYFDDNFLLNNDTAVSLYNKFAKGMPIYDYHCHLSPQEIAENKTFYDIGELFLKSDHYKWRIMRFCGIDEELITGKADFKHKFKAFAKALSFAIGNPVYHWTHMELKQYFDINEPLNEESADRIYEQANRIMADGSFSARNLIKKSNVHFIATTDDPCDDLAYHKRIREISDFETKVTPTFRPDFVCNILKDGFFDYIKRFENSNYTKNGNNDKNRQIETFENLLDVLKNRLDFFESMGCRIADHGIETIPSHEGDFGEAKEIFEKKMNNQTVNAIEAEQYLFYMLRFFGGEYSKRGIAMQIHLSVIRNQNTALFSELGPDCGIDSVGDALSAKSLGKLFDKIENENGLPKVILYTLNPSSYYVLSTMLGNFAGRIPGKMQLGCAWWFCDHRDGIAEQLKTLSNTGAIGQFIGMLTDSRSFVSYERHHYFRRILCSLLGEWVENGEIPADEKFLEKTVRAICFDNAKTYFEKR